MSRHYVPNRETQHLLDTLMYGLELSTPGERGSVIARLFAVDTTVARIVQSMCRDLRLETADSDD